MKKYPVFVLSALVLLTGAGCAATSDTSSTATMTPPSTSSTPPVKAEGKGRAVFMLKNKATTLANVSSVVLTVAKVEVHSTSTGWVTVSTVARQYDLVEMKKTGATQLLADANLAAGTYGQIRLDISKVIVTASGKTSEAKLPSGVLKILVPLTVEDGQTSTAAVDLMLDKSLHLTGEGTYIFAPVLNLQTKNKADVAVDGSDRVTTQGGKVESDEDVGMDEKGETKPDFALPANLQIDARGMIQLQKK